MITSFYRDCNAIQIVSWIGRAMDNGKEMTRPEFNAFEKHTNELLDRIGGTKTGKLLFNALTKTNKRVRIHQGNDYDDNAAKMEPNVTANGPAASVKPFRPAQHNMPLGLKGTENQWLGNDPKVDRSQMVQQITQQMITLGQPTTREQTAVTMAAVLNRTHLGMSLDPQITNNRFMQPHKELPKRLNISSNDFENMVCGLDYMTDAVYYPLCFLLYDYLLPGGGIDSQLRVMNEMTFQHDFTADVKDEGKMFRSKESTAARVEAVVLAHELIHAWRMMAGRRIVAGGWEEEAMTSGIGPFSAWKMTENSFRSDLGLKSRKTYASPSHSSQLMSTLSQQTTNKGYSGVMF